MNEQPPNLSLLRNIKIALFHLSSGMADVLATGLWNRIMISDLGFSATPVSLLVSLRYLLAPLGVWAGRLSDARAVGGYRRLFWIWLGRALMVVSMFTLGMATAALVRGEQVSLVHWLVITLSLTLFSLGTAISGSTFLALIYDRAPEHQRGRAVGLVWAFLLTGFAVGGFLFSRLLRPGEEASVLNADAVQNLFIIAALLLGSLWFFSLVGEERRSSGAVPRASASISLRADLRLVWSNRQTRLFFWYLALSMIFAFAQDAVLEPFGGQVFGMDAAHTTRFSAYWGSMAILSILICLWLRRRFERLTDMALSLIGVGILVFTFALFAVSALASIRGLVTIGLVLLGIGLGVWNVGTLGLMMDMSPAGRAGTFLGFWTMAEVIARGVGVSGGGIVRDVVLMTTNTLNLSYAMVFILEALGLLLALWVLSRVNVKAFQSEYDQQASDTAAMLAGAMD
jgi:BCD family chlorophyll transporter-like MFS transporter